uniref:CLIP domain-containing serine protease n=1 Tax=Anopheles epiroticus TaxID=199890 RepID=A0A182P274_9DIPT
MQVVRLGCYSNDLPVTAKCDDVTDLGGMQWSDVRSCYTPNGQIGVCQVFQYCASLIRLYQYNRNQETVNFLLASQRSCGNRNFNGSPVLCCSDGVQYDPTTTSSPFIEVTTAPPTSVAPLRTADCIGPDNREGYCISIRSCPDVLSEFVQRQRDPQSSVRLGEHDTSTDAETRHIDVPVVRYESHPSYDKKDGHTDLAVLYMEFEVQFSGKGVCV